MANKKTTKSLKDSDYEQSLRLAKQLIKTLKDKPEWTKEDDSRLKKLEKLVVILNKMKVLEKSVASKTANISKKADDEIIKRFLKRREAK